MMWLPGKGAVIAPYGEQGRDVTNLGRYQPESRVALQDRETARGIVREGSILAFC